MPNALTKIFLVCFIVLPTSSSFSFAANEGDPVKSPQWGEVLFYHYKGEDLEALIRLLARERQGALKPHKETANLFAAGLLLDLGLPVAAQERLDQSAKTSLTGWQRSRLSMALARVYYRQQHYQEAEEQLAKINEKDLDKVDVQRKKLMSAQLLFRKREYEAASAQLESIENKGNMQLYAKYNNGLSLLQLLDPQAQSKGQQLLTSIATLEPLDQEQYALKDQAILALALNFLKSNKPLDAQKMLLNLRLDGLVSHDGLLILGWSFAASGDYSKALIYWLKLIETQDVLEPTVQEAWLAVPYAYQKLGDYQSAIAGYERALTSHQQALQEIEALKDREAWRDLLYQQQTAMQSFTKNSPGFQRQLVGDAKFFELLQQWQQLDQWNKKLEFALSALTPIQVMLETNDQRFKEKSAIVREKLSQIEALNLPQKQIELKNILDEQKKQPVAVKLLSQKNAKIWQRVTSAEQITRVLPQEKLGEKAEQLRRLKGVALWNFHRNRPDTLWKGEKDYQKLSQDMEQLKIQEGRLNFILAKPRQPLPEALSRVSELRQRGKNTVDAMARLTRFYETAMARRFDQLLEVRKTALTQLAEQATLALARLRFKALKDEQGKIKQNLESGVDQSRELPEQPDEVKNHMQGSENNE